MSTEAIKRSRAERLEVLLRRWIFNTVHTIDLKTFMSCLAPLTPGNERELHSALVQGLNWFKTELQDLSDSLKNDYELSTKISGLEKAIEESRQFAPINESEKVIPSPDQAWFAANAAHNLDFAEQLESELKKIKENNYKLMERHLELCRQTANKRKQIATLTQEFDQMIEEIQTIPTDELLDLMNQLDVEAIINNTTIN